MIREDHQEFPLAAVGGDRRNGSFASLLAHTASDLKTWKVMKTMDKVSFWTLMDML